LKQNNDTDYFGEIRPYHDDEIRPVLDSLIDNRNFISSIVSFNDHKLNRYLPRLVAFLTRRRLRSQLANVNSVADMQDVIAGYMDKLIEKTATSLTHSGLQELSPKKPYLFISNHRDIVMDPAFVNYMLYHGGFNTVYIAIGDNLLKRPFVTDLMRLNKSFIVKRSLKGRELLKSVKLLSEYIHYCNQQGRNVWIAQRQGRAKDGIDQTDAALIKMLGMAKKPASLKHSIESLNLVPVSISYEYDPCDKLKAHEAVHVQREGVFQKDEDSDIHSIVTGMIGYKGRVHLGFGTELEPAENDANDIALQIDKQVIDNYKLQNSNILAVHALAEKFPELISERLRGPLTDLLSSYANEEISSQARQEFDLRTATMEADLLPYFLQMYANPVVSTFNQKRQ